MAGAVPLGEEVAAAVPRQDAVAPVSVSQWTLSWRRFRKQKRGMFGLAMLLLLIIGVIVIPMVSPFGVETPSGGIPFEPAGTHDHEQGMEQYVHWLGTDIRSRDELVRLAYGGRLSLSLALLSTAALVIVGVIIGAVAGVYGGWVDTGLMRLADFMLALPLLPMYVIAIRLLGFASFVPFAGILRPAQPIDVVHEVIKIGFVFVLFGWMGI